MKRAKDYVMDHPNEQKPTRPVITSEHEHSPNNCQKPHEADQNGIQVNRPPQLADVICESNDTDCYEYATDNGHRMWTFVHDYSKAGSVMRTDNSLPVRLVNSFASIGA